MKDILKIRIQLLHIKPAIWREYLIEKNSTFQELHQIIQLSFEWTCSHLYQFEVGKLRWRAPLDDFDDCDLTMDCKVSDYLKRKGSKANYIYDFGDYWEHEIQVVSTHERDQSQVYPVCLAGERCGPPENCGGSWGYMNILDELKNGFEDEDKQEYYKDLDPDAFNLDEVNHFIQNPDRFFVEYHDFYDGEPAEPAAATASFELDDPYFVAVTTCMRGKCGHEFDEKFFVLCDKMAADLSGNDSPMKRGKVESWAGGIIWTIASLNGKTLFTQGDLGNVIGVAAKTISTKSTQIHRHLKINPLDNRYLDQSLMSLVDDARWMVRVDGVLMDAREMPRAVQRDLHGQGVIPKLPETCEEIQDLMDAHDRIFGSMDTIEKLADIDDLSLVEDQFDTMPGRSFMFMPQEVAGAIKHQLASCKTKEEGAAIMAAMTKVMVQNGMPEVLHKQFVVDTEIAMASLDHFKNYLDLLVNLPPEVIETIPQA